MIVDKRLAGCVGFSCLLPGLSIISLGGVGVQPLVVVLLAYACILPLLKIKLPLHAVIWVLLTLLSYVIATLFSVSPQTSITFSVLQGLSITLGGVGFAAILTATDHRQEFIRGYLVASLLSSVVAVLQLAYWMAFGAVLLLANNENFAIVQPQGRGNAFTPELSALAGLLIPAILCCWFERREGSGLLPPWQRSGWALALLIIGLLSTKSSSLIVFPILLILTSLFQRKSWPKFVRGVASIFLVAALGGMLFLPLYTTRLVNDDATLSGAWRVTKILAGIHIFETYPFTGAGIGLVSDPLFFAPYMQVPPELEWDPEERKGVDSTAIRVLAESGIVGFALGYYPIILFFRQARALSRWSGFRAIGAMSIGLLFSQFFISGYRDQLVFILPMVAFSVAGNAKAIALHRLFQPARQKSADPLLSPYPGHSGS